MGNNLRGAVCLAGMKKIRAALRRIMVSDWPGNVLLNAFLQPLGSTDCYSGTNMLFLQLGLFYLQPRKMYYLPITTTMSFMNLYATVTVVMQDIHSKTCKKALTHSCPIKNLNFLFAALNCYNLIINYIFQIKLFSMFAGLLVIILKPWENNCNCFP